MEGVAKYTMFQALRPHIDNLLQFIFLEANDLSSDNKKMVICNLFKVFGWFFVIIYNIQFIIRVIQSRHNTEGMVDTLFIFLTTFIALVKQIAFNVHLARVKRLFSVTEGKLFAPKNSDQVEILDQNEKVMTRLLFYYCRLVFTACALHSLYPVATKFMGSEVQLISYFPFETSKPSIFVLAAIYLGVMLGIQAYVNLLVDCTIAAFYAQTRVQLRLLRCNLEHLADPENSQLEYMNSYETVLTHHNFYFSYEENCKIRAKIVHCINHYQQIIWFLKEVESITCEALTGQFLATAFVICMTVYKIVGASFYSAEFWSASLYLGCMLFQLYIYCYYGTQVKVESEFICQSVYSSNWLGTSPAIRRELLILMNCASRPIMPFAAKIVPISLQSYFAVLRASYTLFTILDKK